MNRPRSQTEFRRGRDLRTAYDPEGRSPGLKMRSTSTQPPPGASSSSSDYTAANSIPLNDDAMSILQRRSTEITRFRVYSRVRPFIEEELAEMREGPLRSIVEMKENVTVILDPKDDWIPKAQFEFDASLWSIPETQALALTYQDTVHHFVSQFSVYNLVAKPNVASAFDGFNSCILTYGQTGSGKTYTMMGKYNPTLVCGGEGEEGIIPRVCNDIFQMLEDKRKGELSKPESERISYRIEVNFVEIYLERVRDLLDPSLKNGKDVKMSEAKIRQDPTCGPFVEGVTKYQVENWQHCCQLLERGSQHRTTCATLVHQQSSRSHAIFQLTVVMEETIQPKDRYSRPSTRTRAGRMNLVDLAGSERGGMTDYVKESAAINTSLLALRRVIDNLVERQNILLDQARAEITGGSSYGSSQATLPQVPFRDSVLTWLLSDSIGGNARTTMVATLSPMAKNYGDTLATLQWSSKARNLVTLVKMNDVQTVVTGGMNSKAVELNQAVFMQRQNVDSLRDALQQKQEYAESLEKETKRVMKETIQEKAMMQVVYQVNAVIVIQRFARHCFFQSKKRSLLIQLSSIERRILSEQTLLEERKLEVADAERGVQENETLLLEAMNDEDSARAQAKAICDSQEEFQYRRAAVEEQYQMIRGQLGKDEESCKEEIAGLQQRVVQMEADIGHTKSETKRTEEVIRLVSGELSKLSDPLWRSNAQKAETDVKDLRLKIEVANRLKTEATIKRDALLLQHQKIKKSK